MAMSWALPLSKLPTTREEHDTLVRAKDLAQYKAGYLPYSFIDGWQQLRKDFAYWRALKKGLETAATAKDRAWFDATSSDVRLTLPRLSIICRSTSASTKPIGLGCRRHAPCDRK